MNEETRERRIDAIPHEPADATTVLVSKIPLTGKKWTPASSLGRSGMAVRGADQRMVGSYGRHESVCPEQRVHV